MRHLLVPRRHLSWISPCLGDLSSSWTFFLINVRWYSLFGLLNEFDDLIVALGARRLVVLFPGCTGPRSVADLRVRPRPLGSLHRLGARRVGIVLLLVPRSADLRSHSVRSYVRLGPGSLVGLGWRAKVGPRLPLRRLVVCDAALPLGLGVLRRSLVVQVGLLLLLAHGLIQLRGIDPNVGLRALVSGALQWAPWVWRLCDLNLVVG